MTPKIWFADETSELPVPLCLVGNDSGEPRAYSTPYMTLQVKLYAQSHAR